MQFVKEKELIAKKERILPFLMEKLYVVRILTPDFEQNQEKKLIFFVFKF